MQENRKIENLFSRLVKTSLYKFPERGYTESISVPSVQGVYIIYNGKGKVLHVGRTTRGRRGLRQRLNNHLLGQSSFVEQYLHGEGSKLHKGYKFRYLAITNHRDRALVEALAIGKLCPAHLGLGE